MTTDVEPGLGQPIAPTAPHQRVPLETASRRALTLYRPERARTLFPLLPLQLVLTAQAALSLRLSNTAFADEALVLLSGRQEIRSLFHGSGGTGGLAAYFSGEPALYPVLAAAVDARFGLEAARLLSLVFMLGATVLLWSSTRALFGRAAANGAAAVFGLAGPTLFLGHFAVYDVPAVLLFAASLRILIATARRSLWTTLSAVPTAVLAIATSYASALYLPVLALVATLTALAAAPAPALAAPASRRRPPLALAVARGALFAATVAAVTGIWLLLLGPDYRHGFEAATTGRGAGADGSGVILGDALRWGLPALALGLIGTVAVARRHRATPHVPHHIAPVLLTLVLALAVLPAPLYQLHIHTLQSLQKHIDIGLLFAAAAAGVALSIPLRAALRARYRYGLAAVAAFALAAVGVVQSGSLFAYWPNSKALVNTLKQAMGKGGGHYLAEASTVPQYYTQGLPDGAHNDWQNTYSFGYVDAAGAYVTGLPAYRQAIAEHYFKLIMLSYQETPALDRQIDAPLKAGAGYRLIAAVPAHDAFGTTDFEVWQALG
jgi:hypothetical protein